MYLFGVFWSLRNHSKYERKRTKKLQIRALFMQRDSPPLNLCESLYLPNQIEDLFDIYDVALSAKQCPHFNNGVVPRCQVHPT